MSEYSLTLKKVVKHNQALGFIDQLSPFNIVTTCIENKSYLCDLAANDDQLHCFSPESKGLSESSNIIQMVTLKELGGFVSVYSFENENQQNFIRVTTVSESKECSNKDFPISRPVRSICSWVNGKDFVCSVVGDNGSSEIQFWNHEKGYQYSIGIPNEMEGLKYEFTNLYTLQHTRPAYYVCCVSKITPRRTEESQEPKSYYEVWIWNIVKKRLSKRLRRMGQFNENEITSISSVSIILEKESPAYIGPEEMEDGEEGEDNDDEEEEEEEMLVTGGRDGITFWRDLKIQWRKETCKEVEVEEGENFIILGALPEDIDELEDEEIRSIRCVEWDDAMWMFVVTQYGIRCFDLGELELAAQFFDDEITVSGGIGFQRLMENEGNDDVLEFYSLNPIKGAINIWKFNSN